MKRKILLVDDEPGILNSLRICLRNEPYEVLTAEQGSEALEVLKVHDVCLIVSDINMPGMDGIDLICRANVVSPNSIKMVLSAYADIELVMDAINRGYVWRYLTKPWQPEDIRIAIRNAIDFYNAQVEKRKLLAELETKKQELTQLTDELEQTVNKRTAHIQSELVLMRMLLNGAELGLFCKAVFPALSDIFQTKKISVLSLLDNKIFSLEGNNPNSSCDSIEQIRQAQERMNVFVDDQIIVEPIINIDQVYGVLIVKDYGVSYEQVNSEYESYLALVTIALTHYAMKLQSPKMLEDIDQMIKGLK